MRCRRHKKWPPPPAAGPFEGSKARERAEDALGEVRQRRAEQLGLRRFFQAQYAANHFGEDVDRTWEGRT